jgi:hypothetical protein
MRIQGDGIWNLFVTQFPLDCSHKKPPRWRGMEVFSGAERLSCSSE